MAPILQDAESPLLGEFSGGGLQRTSKVEPE